MSQGEGHESKHVAGEDIPVRAAGSQLKQHSHSQTDGTEGFDSTDDIPAEKPVSAMAPGVQLNPRMGDRPTSGDFPKSGGSHHHRSCQDMVVLTEIGRCCILASLVHKIGGPDTIFPHCVVLYWTLYMALPRSSVEALAYIASLLSASLVGSLGTVQLSGLMMGSMFFNVTGLSITIGLSCGMESICGQLYGAGHYGAVGVLLQRAAGVCLALGLPSYVLMWFAGPLMTAMVTQYLVFEDFPAGWIVNPTATRPVYSSPPASIVFGQ